MDTAMIRVQRLTEQLEAATSPADSVERRRVETAATEPTEPTQLDQTDIDNITKRVARGAFPSWKCWALVQVLSIVCAGLMAVEYTKVIKMLLISSFFFFGRLIPQLDKTMPSRSVLANWVLRFG